MLQTQFHSRRLRRGRSGTALAIGPQKAGWELVTFGVRALAKSATWKARLLGQECCLVLLKGTCHVAWQAPDGRLGEATLGPREHVFASYPHAVYLPPGCRMTVTARTAAEIADCRAPSTAKGLSPRVVRPQDCGFEIRGGGNATRQIIDILPPACEADRLMICEVLTPAGNWSSYPPHKHDRDRPPVEADLEEIYYFRFSHPDGYGFQRVYSADGRRDETFRVTDGDLVVVRDGYHPFVTAFGYDAYYLNVLAGSRRSMAATDDPRYAALRAHWPPPDPRMPLIPRPD
jgi:5-deoxy-glucuronate isomerase